MTELRLIRQSVSFTSLPRAAKTVAASATTLMNLTLGFGNPARAASHADRLAFAPSGSFGAVHGDNF